MCIYLLYSYKVFMYSDVLVFMTFVGGIQTFPLNIPKDKNISLCQNIVALYSL